MDERWVRSPAWQLSLVEADPGTNTGMEAETGTGAGIRPETGTGSGTGTATVPMPAAETETETETESTAATANHDPQAVGGSGPAGLQLIVSAGADECYWVDELPHAEAARRLHAAWHSGAADALDALREDAACAAALRQLRRVGAVVPQGGVQPVRRVVVRWWGRPAPAWLAELDRQLATGALVPPNEVQGHHAPPATGGVSGAAHAPDVEPGQALVRLQRVADAGVAALGASDTGVDLGHEVVVYVRTTDDWQTALPAYCKSLEARPHLLLDLAYHHSVVIGPWVVPGQTACLACLGTRTVRRWADAPVPPSPQALAQPALSVALLLQVLTAAGSPGGQAAWIEHSTHVDLRTLQSQRARVYRQPWCPACAHLPDAGSLAERHGGRLPMV